MFSFSTWSTTVTISLAALGAFTSVSAQDSIKGPIIDLGYALHQATIPNNTFQLYNFSNIRFAEPPLGDLRFSAPVPPTGRNTTINDGQLKSVCPQGYSPQLPLIIGELGGVDPATLEAEAAQLTASITIDSLPSPGQYETEDCLFLDVIVPQQIFNGSTTNEEDACSGSTNSTGAPVLVYIYGGGFTGGNKAAEDPSGLIAASQANSSEGMIYVSMNYRLGMFGFLAGPTFQAQNGTGNVGLWDQRLALQWVQSYIHLFGGDPNRVTIMGESAGGGSVIHQITAFGGEQPAFEPSFNGTLDTSRALFKQGIAQSPAFQPIPSAIQTENTFNSVLNYSSQVTGLNITTLSDLRSLSFGQLYATNALMQAHAPFAISAFGPAIDGLFVPDVPGKLFLSGKYNHDVKVMTAYNRNESYLFVPTWSTTSSDFDEIVDALMPVASPAVISQLKTKVYPAIFDGTQPYVDQLGRYRLFFAEGAILCNTRFLARAFANQTYNYMFNAGAAMHGQDVQFTFFGGPNEIVDNLGLDVEEGLARKMQGFITRFVGSGDPNGGEGEGFPVYGGDSNVLVMGGEGDGDVQEGNLASGRCEWWEGTYYG